MNKKLVFQAVYIFLIKNAKTNFTFSFFFFLNK